MTQPSEECMTPPSEVVVTTKVSEEVSEYVLVFAFSKLFYIYFFDTGNHCRVPSLVKGF